MWSVSLAFKTSHSHDASGGVLTQLEGNRSQAETKKHLLCILQSMVKRLNLPGSVILIVRQLEQSQKSCFRRETVFMATMRSDSQHSYLASVTEGLAEEGAGIFFLNTYR